MQPHKTKLALQIGAVVLGAMCASSAFADTFTASVITIDDVEITERVPLTFGENIFTTADTSCTLQVSNEAGTANPAPSLMNYSTTADVDEGADFGDTDGDGCVNDATDATAGVFDISGLSGAAVNILLTTLVQTDTAYTYAPDTACYVAYSGDTADDGDSCETLTPGIVVNTPLAAAAEDDATGGGSSAGTSVDGALSFVVGGTIGIGSDGLDPETTYDLQFQVDVTY